jgi:CBS domain-containing protein
MPRVCEILDRKGSHIYSIGPEDTVYDAIALMADKEVGALIVIQHHRPVGIISERDYTRNVILKDKSSKATKVAEIMTSELITVSSREHVDECVSLMKKHHIRHLPVSDDGDISGVLSLRDLFSAIIDEQAHAIEDLQHYVRGEV